MADCPRFSLSLLMALAALAPAHAGEAAGGEADAVGLMAGKEVQFMLAEELQAEADESAQDEPERPG
jgi:hypothetical protein